MKGRKADLTVRLEEAVCEEEAKAAGELEEKEQEARRVACGLRPRKPRAQKYGASET